MTRFLANKFVQMTGCALVIAALGFVSWLIGVKAIATTIAVLAMVLVVVHAAHSYQTARLVNRFRATHGKDGRDLLIVYSDSKQWAPYIEEHWLPKWKERAVVLNRSRPSSRSQLEVRLWERLSGITEHTPVVIVIPHGGRIHVLRFFKAFKDHKHGNSAQLKEKELQLEQILERMHDERAGS